MKITVTLTLTLQYEGVENEKKFADSLHGATVPTLEHFAEERLYVGDHDPVDHTITVKHHVHLDGDIC
jgi:hypothetical protein